MRATARMGDLLQGDLGSVVADPEALDAQDPSDHARFDRRPGHKLDLAGRLQIKSR